jgi:hypothetical protein
MPHSSTIRSYWIHLYRSFYRLHHLGSSGYPSQRSRSGCSCHQHKSRYRPLLRRFAECTRVARRAVWRNNQVAVCRRRCSCTCTWVGRSQSGICQRAGKIRDDDVIVLRRRLEGDQPDGAARQRRIGSRQLEDTVHVHFERAAIHFELDRIPSACGQRIGLGHQRHAGTLTFLRSSSLPPLLISNDAA